LVGDQALVGDQGLAGDRALLERPVDLAPGAPFEAEIALPGDVSEGDLYVEVCDASGASLLAYRPRAPQDGRMDEPLPEPQRPPPPPAELETAEALYLAGLHLEQYRHPTIDPEPYWERALELDPGDARSNNALGLAHLRRGRYTEAEAHFRRAIATLTRRNPNPRDGEPFYNLGLALRYQRRFVEAYDAFYKAIWSYAWQAAAYTALAEIDCLRGDWDRALDHLDRALQVNARHLKARNLRATVLRRLGHCDRAEIIAWETVALDPLDFWSRNELVHIARARAEASAVQRGIQDLTDLLRVGAGREETQVYLDVAFDYAAAGLWEEAEDWLGRIAVRAPAGRPLDPMILYALGFFAWQQGREGETRTYYRHASALSPYLVFHARLEELEILQHVLALDPDDARAHYYLGNLLYDKLRYEEAIEHWQAAGRLEPGFATPWRNLGVAAHNVRHDPQRARVYYERALEADPHDGRVLSELDQLAARLSDPPEARLARLDRYPDLIAERDDLTAARAALLNQLGRPREALDLLLARRFHPWEGGEGLVSDQYEGACLLLGQAALAAGRADEALAHLQAALVYPDNLGEGRSLFKPDAHLHYHIALAHEALGDAQAARASLERAAASLPYPSATAYYQALALDKLGQPQAAQERLRELRDHAQQRLEEGRQAGFSTSVPAFVFFEDDPTRRHRIAHRYMLGLAQLGLGEVDAARKAFEAVLELDANHLGAREELRKLAQ
jgi:tetratricopeptide (TPR) repeat protein